jgi:hypothetical protein
MKKAKNRSLTLRLRSAGVLVETSCRFLAVGKQRWMAFFSNVLRPWWGLEASGQKEKESAPSKMIQNPSVVRHNPLPDGRGSVLYKAAARGSVLKFSRVHEAMRNNGRVCV